MSNFAEVKEWYYLDDGGERVGPFRHASFPFFPFHLPAAIAPQWWSHKISYTQPNAVFHDGQRRASATTALLLLVLVALHAGYIIMLLHDTNVDLRLVAPLTAPSTPQIAGHRGPTCNIATATPSSSTSSTTGP